MPRSDHLGAGFFVVTASPRISPPEADDSWGSNVKFLLDKSRSRPVSWKRRGSHLIMKNFYSMRSCFTLVLALAVGAVACAQEPAAVRRIVLPSLDSQVAARMSALDRRLNPVHAPNLAAALAAQLASPGGPFDSLPPILADARNQEIWSQLPDEYYRMMQESGDALVSLPGTASPVGVAWPSAQVRRLCHERLASLPRTSLELYRQRIDAEAKAILEQGRQARSPLPLRRLVDDLFCSRYGDQALDLLGDLAFERGHFDEAGHWWRLLAPLDARHNQGLKFPDAKMDLVRVQAKQILAALFAGRFEDAQVALTRLQKEHPNAKGLLAGQDGVYGNILEKTLASLLRERLVNNEEPWTTFGGNATRNRTLSLGLSWNLWEDGPAWHVPLPALDEIEVGKEPLAERGSPTRKAAFHPIIVNEQVLIADHRSLVSYHLKTGKELFRYDLKAAGLVDPGPGIDAKIALPRFTLSADDRRAYVRLGRLGLGPKKEAKQSDATYLVCLDLTEPAKDKKRELWHVQASAEDKAPAAFEGSPLVCDGRVYIALSRLAGRRVVTSIVCYDVLGRRRWSRDVCDCPEFEDGADGPRNRQHLLTWAAGQIVYASHSGAIVAVDALTGQPTWGVRYPSRGPLTPELEPSPRDLAPCIYADGCVFAAPLDTDRIFCVEAVSGQIRWELESIEIVHLYGVSGGRLLASTRNGLVSIQAATGEVEWIQPSEGRLPNLGRGLIAGPWLIWPTQDAELPYRAVTLRTGEPPNFDPTRLSKLPVGNLAFGHGCLAIAGLNELVVYVPAHQGQPLPPPDVRPQARLESLYQRARWQASAGQTEAAVQSYRQLLDATKSHPQATTWQALIESRLSLLAPAPPPAKPTQEPTTAERLLRADQALKTEHWGEAADAFRRLLGAVLPADIEGRCLVGLAHAYEGQRDYRSAWRTWTALDDRFGGVLDPSSKQPYRALVPSSKREPYLSALATLAVEGPALPLVQAWSHDDGRAWLGEDNREDAFFCTQAGQLTCRNLADGALRWKQTLDFEPTGLERWRDLVLLTGPDAAQGWHVHDGQTAWTSPAPSRTWRLGSVRGGVPTIAHGGAGFVHAQRWEDTLLLLDDQRRFLRLRIDTGEITWQYASPGAALRSLDAGAFGPHVARIGSNLLVQSVSGQPYRLDAKAVPFGTATRPWIQSPQIVGNRIIRAAENGRIVAQHLAPPHEEIWTYQAPWPTSLTGEFCRLVARNSVLLAMVPRNEGNEWIRLDVERGKMLWALRAGQLPDGLDVDSVCIGDTMFFYADQEKLYARSLNDGTLHWTHALPTRAARWGIRYTKDYLAVYPTEASKGAAFSVSFIDPWAGGLLQRLIFADAYGPGEVLLSPRLALVSAGGRIYGFRGLGPE